MTYTALKTNPNAAARNSSASSVWRLVVRKQQTIVALNAVVADPTIYCIHSIGGDLHGYDRLTRALGDSCRVFGLQVPGSAMVPDLARDIESLAAQYVEALTRFQATGPFILAGYSAGAVIALEVAQQLRALGRSVPLVVAFDGAPHVVVSAGSITPAGTLWGIAERIFWRLRGVKVSDLALRHRASRAAFRQIIRQSGHYERKVERDGVDKVAERNGWSANQQRFMADLYKAIISYVPRRFDGRVVLYEAQAQPILRPHNFGHAWISLASDCEVVRVRTRHSAFFESPWALRQIAAHLKNELHRAGGKTYT